ncbi:hypothetical protein BU198_05240 [Streptomyces sp. CBMA156]|nr:hypothetical protein [Streptomyces sp. CBMA156]
MGQAVGRALRMRPGSGKVATVVVPVLLGVGENGNQLASWACDGLSKLLMALRAYDAAAWSGWRCRSPRPALRGNRSTPGSRRRSSPPPARRSCTTTTRSYPPPEAHFARHERRANLANAGRGSAEQGPLRQPEGRSCPDHNCRRSSRPVSDARRPVRLYDHRRRRRHRATVGHRRSDQCDLCGRCP